MKRSQTNSINMNKTNLTLWKNQNYTSQENQTKPPIESEYMENLKKQIYFMEMELNLMKEREKEIDKTGGFTQLFNDERDPSQHILQLKSKYASMRKNMETKQEDLQLHRRSVLCSNFSLKSKLESVHCLEKEMYTQLLNLEEKSKNKLFFLETEHLKRNRDRLELEANYRMGINESNVELSKNIELEWGLNSEKKTDELTQEQFDKEMELLSEMTKEKIKTYEEINNKIAALESKTQEEPYYKIEVEKNSNYKKRIEALEREIHEINSQVEMLEKSNEFLVQKKENVITERKKLIDLNDELAREIEAKNQLNEIRVQKKVKENNSEEISSLELHLENVNKTITELEGKIAKETEKKKYFGMEIIKLNIDLRHKEETRNALIASVDGKMKELKQLKEEAEGMKKYNVEYKEKLAKEKTENQLVRNRHKILAEEHASISSRYNFVVNNYDYTSNLKKISLEDLKLLKQTNLLVNDSIQNFANKVGSFKKQNLQNILDKDELLN